jgi:hypothetical protein
MAEDKAGIAQSIVSAFSADPCMSTVLITVLSAFALVYSTHKSYANNLRESTKQTIELMNSINEKKRKIT